MNIVSLGLDVSSFDEKRKAVLQEFIQLFDTLSKYDGKNINPSMGDGLVSFNQSIKETTKLLDELNAKIANLQTASTNSKKGTDSMVQSNTMLGLSTKEYNKLVDEGAKTLAKLAAATSDQAKLNAAYRLELSNTTKQILEEAKAHNENLQAKEREKQKTVDYLQEQNRVVEVLRSVAIEQDRLEKQNTIDKKNLEIAKSKEYREEQMRVVESLRAVAKEQDRKERQDNTDKKKAETKATRDLAEAEKLRTKALKEESLAQKNLASDYDKLRAAMIQQGIEYQKLALAKGKEDPAAKAKLAEYAATASIINNVDKELNHAAGGAAAFGESIRRAFSVLTRVAYVLPGLGIAGIFTLMFEAVASVAEGLGIFDTAMDKAITTQEKMIASQKEMIDVLKQVEEAYKGAFAQTRITEESSQAADNHLLKIEAEGKSTLDRLNAEREIIRIKASDPNIKFHEVGGAAGVDKAQKDFEAARGRLDQINQDIKNKQYETGFFNREGKGTKEQGEKIQKNAKEEFDLASQNFLKLQKIAKDNNDYTTELANKDLAIKTYLEEQKRKLILETNKFEVAAIKDKNEIILNDERSMLGDRLQAYERIRNADVKLAQAQRNYALSRPDAKNADGSFTTESLVASRAAREAILEADRRFAEQSDKIREVYRQRNLKATTQIKKDEAETAAIANEKIARNDKNNLDERLVAYMTYVRKKQEQQDLEYLRDRTKRGLTKEEKDALSSNKDRLKDDLQADVEKQVYDIVASSLQRQLKLVKETNAVEEEVNIVSYTKELKDLNDSFEKKLISRVKYHEERQKIDRKYKVGGFDETIVDSEKDLARLKEERRKLDDLKSKSDQRVDTATVVAKEAKDSGLSERAPKKELDAALGEQQAIADAISKVNIEIDNEDERLNKAKLAREKARQDELDKNEQDRIKKRQQYIDIIINIEKQLYEAIKTIGNDEFEDRLEKAQQLRDLKIEQYDQELGAIEKSTLSIKDKAALEIQLETEKMVAEKNAAAEEKRIKHEQAVFNKNLSIAQIIIATALAVIRAAPVIPLQIEAAATGAIALATAVATDIPSYAEGTDSHPGGLARYGEKGKEIVKEPYKSPYIVLTETISYLPKGTEIIPIRESPVFGEEKDEGWDQVRWLAKQMVKRKEPEIVNNNYIKVDLGFMTYRSKIIGNG